jgi:hypothetical protein
MRLTFGPFSAVLHTRDAGGPRGIVAADLRWYDRVMVAAEWSRAHSAAAQVTLGDEHPVTFHLALGWQLFVTLHAQAVRRAVRRLTNGEPRATGLRVFSGAIWWDVWSDPSGGWPRHQSRWRSGNFDPANTLFGRTVATIDEVLYSDARVVLPEGLYRADVRVTYTVWKRPRWPWPTEARWAYSAHLPVAVPVGPTAKRDHVGRLLPDHDHTLAYALADIAAAVMADRDEAPAGWAPPRRTL